MTLGIKRLFAALIVPPLIGALLLFALEVTFDRQWGGSFAGHLELLFVYLGYGAAMCLLPGFVSWGILEVARRKWPYSVAGMKHLAASAALGGCSGFVFALVLGQPRLADFIHLVPVGIVVGATTGSVMSRCELCSRKAEG